MSETTAIDCMIGRTFVIIAVDHDREAMTFVDEHGKQVRFFHDQWCCEHVRIEDITGDLADLVGFPIFQAEKSTRKGGSDDGTATWTFYKFATVKGAVTVRWLGESNGYYSEEVLCKELP